MDELEKLIAEKKRIEFKIMELQKGSVCVTSTMKFIKNQNTGDELKYQVSAKGSYMARRYNKDHPYDLIAEVKRDRWYPFVREATPQEAIQTLMTIGKEIPDMIEKIKEYMKINNERIEEE